MKLYIQDKETKKKYPLKGITLREYKNGTHNEEILFDQIYKILMKHGISDVEITDKDGKPA
tara:strand:+ start:1153 stop:1335 length:183 start_codon:yes stop_codon:yes gene_type:complete